MFKSLFLCKKQGKSCLLQFYWIFYLTSIFGKDRIDLIEIRTIKTGEDEL